MCVCACSRPALKASGRRRLRAADGSYDEKTRGEGRRTRASARSCPQVRLQGAGPARPGAVGRLLQRGRPASLRRLWLRGAHARPQKTCPPCSAHEGASVHNRALPEFACSRRYVMQPRGAQPLRILPRLRRAVASSRTSGTAPSTRAYCGEARPTGRCSEASIAGTTMTRTRPHFWLPSSVAKTTNARLLKNLCIFLRRPFAQSWQSSRIS